MCGPTTIPTLSGKKYILVIVDDHTKFTWVYFLWNKSETTNELINFIHYIELRVRKPLRILTSDNAGEFKNTTLDIILVSKGIEHNFSTPIHSTTEWCSWKEK